MTPRILIKATKFGIYRKYEEISKFIVLLISKFSKCHSKGCQMITDSKSLRKTVDAYLDNKLSDFYKSVPGAQALVDDTAMSREYYIRHTIEIIVRLRMKRTIDALTIHYFTKTAPKLAKKWCHYTEDEMLHDEWFLADLVRMGISREQVYGTEPLAATKLLQGYFYYGIEHEGRPLASLCSSYLIEYGSVRTQPQWLDKFAKQQGDEFVRGARAHVQHDTEDDHTDFVWDVIYDFVKTPADEQAIFKHLDIVSALFFQFYKELNETVRVCPPSMSEAIAAVA